MEEKLESLRKQIDKIDKDLLISLAKRTEIVRKIGKLKKAQGKALLDEKRWQQVLEGKLGKAETMNLSKDFVKKIYNLVHVYSLEIERKNE